MLYCLGPGGLKVFNRIEKKPVGDIDVFNSALNDLTSYFAPMVCVGVDRYKFYHRKQGKDESIEDFVAALKNLALSCRFGTLHDELIRDQIVMQASNTNIQEQLWAKGEAPLQEVIDLDRRASCRERV